MLAYAPISSVMTTHLVTVNPEDNLLIVKEIFDNHNFHHIPVTRYKELLGIISRSDFNHFYGGASTHSEDQIVNELRLKRTLASDIMTTRLGKVDSQDRINVALEIFCLNRFHALPVVDDGELVGLITPFDILKALQDQKPTEPHLAYEQ
jgi:acetoin utilization protein AcuB